MLSSIAQSCYRMANDIRLLQHDRQVEDPFEQKQIGCHIGYVSVGPERDSIIIR